MKSEEPTSGETCSERRPRGSLEEKGKKTKKKAQVAQEVKLDERIS